MSNLKELRMWHLKLSKRKNVKENQMMFLDAIGVIKNPKVHEDMVINQDDRIRNC